MAMLNNQRVLEKAEDRNSWFPLGWLQSSRMFSSALSRVAPDRPIFDAVWNQQPTFDAEGHRSPPFPVFDLYPMKPVGVARAATNGGATEGGTHHHKGSLEKAL